MAPKKNQPNHSFQQENFQLLHRLVLQFQKTSQRLLREILSKRRLPYTHRDKLPSRRAQHYAHMNLFHLSHYHKIEGDPCYYIL